MDLVFVSATVARRDAGTEPPWMGSRRVAETNTRFMSARNQQSGKPDFIGGEKVRGICQFAGWEAVIDSDFLELSQVEKPRHEKDHCRPARAFERFRAC